jgi:P27 family predicted phage terminase small subunit
MGVGRKNKTLEMKILAGNPGKRSLKKNRAVAPAGRLRMPADFSEEKAQIWNETIASAPRGVLKPADTELLISFVEQVALRRQAQRELEVMAKDNAKEQADGTIVSAYLAVETERGWVKNPLITVIDTAVKNIRYLASELGLSPASRERLGSAGGEEEINPFAQFKKPAANQTTA